MFQYLLILVLLLVAAPARADIEFKFGGQVAADVRFRMPTVPVSEPVQHVTIPPGDVNDVLLPSQQRLLPYGFSRNTNLIKAQLSLSVSDKVKAVADVEFIWYGYSDLRDIESTTLRERIDPYYLEAHAAYVDVYRILPRLDLRIGRQVVTWGTADKFNPTNNLNTLDLSDPLLFGRALANQMIRLDWNPWGDLIFTAVWVPVFRPARLPRTAPLAVTEVFRPAPVQEADMQASLGQLAFLNPPSAVRVYTMQPEPSIDNSQFAARLAGRIRSVDLSLSYYYGRFGIPTPAWASFKANGLVEVGVLWPRMHVLGFDMAGSIEKLNGLGYWVEAGLFFPQKITYGLYNDDPLLSLTGHDPITFEKLPSGQNAVRTNSDQFQRPIVVPSTPFLKLTAGFDYSWNKYLYTNFQYVYGFIDEFGFGTQSYARAGAMLGDTPRREARIGHYLVAGADLKFFSDALLIRFFGAFKVPQHDDPEPKFTAVLFPQIAWAVWDATELSLGAFIFIGDRDTKFGDPAAGSTELFMKARFTY